MSEKSEIALITGASAGLGAEYARQLAGRCQAMILVGRRRERLAALARELASAQVECHLLAVDLAEPLGVTRVVETVRQRGPISILVNSAGFSTYGRFADLDPAAQQAMVDVHITATLALTRAVLPGMREAGGGTIINLSSLASFFHLRKVAVYAASKAFLNSFSETLQLEEQEAGIRVQSLCPGHTRTEFHQRDDFADFRSERLPPEMWMEAPDVVAESLAVLERGGPVVLVPGEVNRQLAEQARAD